MDAFSAILAFGPLALYLLLLGMINLLRRPLVISGTRETLAVALAVGGLMLVGPMQLFMPQEAAGRFGGWIWLLLLGFYVLSITLVILLSRPRLIIYNVTLDELRPALLDATGRLDPDTVFSGGTVDMPLARVQFRLEAFGPLANVMLIAGSDDQSQSGWSRLQTALRQSLRETQVAAKPHGFWLTLCGVAMLSALVFWAVDDPQMIARGFDRLLNP